MTSKIRIKPALVKICGITNTDDARWAVNYGTDYIGFNFVHDSPRKVSVEKAREIAAALPPFVKPVGVFVDANPDEIEMILKKVPIRVLQLHGNETSEDLERMKSRFGLTVWKAIRVENESSLDMIPNLIGIADALLLDAYRPDQAGGTGETFNWDLAVNAKNHGIPVFLAGGLNPDNVQDALVKVEPAGVDTASGVEKEGHPRKKDLERMKTFILKAKGN